MITCHIGPRIILDFWLERTPKAAILYCKKHSDERPLDECEKYAILSILASGELRRHTGLPIGWGFKLTNEKKIKEVL